MMVFTSVQREIDKYKKDCTFICQLPDYLKDAIKTLLAVYSFDGECDVNADEFMNEKIWSAEELLDWFTDTNGKMPCLDYHGKLHYVIL